MPICLATAKTESSFQLLQKTWMFRGKYPIVYEVATSNTRDLADSSNDQTNVVPILLLNGFGVGTFHQHRLMKQLLFQSRDSSLAKNRNTFIQYKIYGIDYLGQGKSWPLNCNDGMSEDEYNLCYSADTWIDQLKNFLQQVIIPTTTHKIHIIGNSVGGYLGTILSYRHPHLVSSLTLLNATPVWGLNLPLWDGKLPAPVLPKIIGRLLFDTIRDFKVIDKYLDAAYVNRQAFEHVLKGKEVTPLLQVFYGVRQRLLMIQIEKACRHHKLLDSMMR
jgi:pimeloyl-ACP methyl ester carboxylesterase